AGGRGGQGVHDHAGREAGGQGCARGEKTARAWPLRASARQPAARPVRPATGRGRTGRLGRQIFGRPVRYLLDTHALFWWLYFPELLPPKIRDIIGDPDVRVFASAVSAYEMSYKHH